jgi:N-methylhydantoinase B/oxoprolinase/acetone carboxylase alpha subunit
VLDAINNFRTAIAPFRGATGIAAYNPQSPEGQRLASAYEVLKMTMRDESLLNTGVLQPGENVMIERMLRSPASVMGVLTSIDAYNTMLDEFAGFVQRGTDRVRSSANLPPVDWSQPRQNITPDPRGANRPDPLGLLGGPRR